MDNRLNIEEFIAKSENIPVIDVRTPAEFELAHFPGAYNIPIFSNEERAIIGTLYKKQGKQIAILKGLELVGPKLADFSKKAIEMAVNNQLLVYCWRGGMRSASMQWLFSTLGIETFRLEGGYKSFRNHLFDTFDKIKKLVVLGGYTGVGKTDVLMFLEKNGQQVINLEGLAHHKGSTFGKLGQMEKQPTSEHFANLLFFKMKDFDFEKIIWTEDESKRIGSVHQPDNFYDKLRSSTLIKLKSDRKIRVQRLLNDYGGFDDDVLIEGIERIAKRLGPNFTKQAVLEIDTGNMEAAINICLDYYDKTYDFGISKRNSQTIFDFEITNIDSSMSMNELVKFAESIITS